PEPSTGDKRRSRSARSMRSGSTGRSAASFTRAALADSAPRQRCRVEQLRELFLAQVGHLGGDLANRPALGICLLRDRSTLLVADHGIERGYEHRVAIER